MLIAICDDNAKCIDELKGQVMSYFNAHMNWGIKPEIHTFQSGADFLESFSAHKYEIVFLDIDMPEINGMELASRVRQTDKNVQIVFVTYMDDQLPFGYRFKASGFVVKPFTQARINSVIGDTMEWIKAGRKKPIEVKIKGGGITWLEMREIMYIESYRHYMEAVGKEGGRFEFLGKISSLETELAEHNFVRLHRSYLVNLAYVFIRNAESVRLTSGLELPIGRSYAEKFISLYEKYRKENG